jgi:hypothetical protein
MAQMIVGGITPQSGFQLTRPADTLVYAAGDAIANATSGAALLGIANAASIPGGSGVVLGGRLVKSGSGVTNADFRLHFFRNYAGAAPNDNVAWAPTAADLREHLGYIDFLVANSITINANVVYQGVLSRSNITFNLDTTTSIFAVLEARGAYTPTSAEVFDVDIDVSSD